MCDQVDIHTYRQTDDYHRAEPSPLLHSFIPHKSVHRRITHHHSSCHYSQYNIDPSYHHHGIHIHIHIHHGAHHHQDEKARRGRQGLL